jgi:hypothetical protein
MRDLWGSDEPTLRVRARGQIEQSGGFPSFGAGRDQGDSCYNA